MKAIQEIFSELQTPRKVVVTMHQKPDADAMGAALALSHFLKSLGHQVTVISPTNWAGWVNWMPGAKEVLDYEKKGIRINVVCPGVIKTPMIDRFTGKQKEVEKQFENMEPIGRMGQPNEVAEAVLWLCSDAASFVTGHSMAVDGGWIAQ